MSILAAILVLGVLIFAHETGHFLVAKRVGVGVRKFSLGFGPRLLGFRRGETEYLISAVPLGGYVKMMGEDPQEQPPDLGRSFSHKSVGKRALIVLAGPCFNLLLAFLLFWFSFVIGIPALTAKVGEVKEGFPAAAAGIRPGDRIVALDGEEIQNWSQLALRIHRSPGKPLKITLEREGKRQELIIAPQLVKQKNILGEEVEVGLLGIGPSEEFVLERLNPLRALPLALSRTYEVSALTVLSIVRLIQGKIPAKTIGGPILVAQLAGEQARMGMINLLLFTAVLSINLAILNLLPIPILDGGHLLFFSLEAIRGRPVALRKRELAQQIGLILLVALMIFAFYNDLFRLWTGP
ncbi:MAG: RIP metalloprotease RseP [candidate division NC10 bacterium]|nr:RIP metalloprotease RseP [candidate division NC10 bacterium]